MPGRRKCEPGCTCKKHQARSAEYRSRLSAAHAGRDYSALKCDPGCTCGHHTRVDYKVCEPGCTCGRHEQSDEHRRKNSEGVRKAIAEGRKGGPDEIAKRVATRKSRGDYQSAEALESMQQARREALANGLIRSSNYLDGRSHHEHYNRWFNMVARCTKPNHPEWRRYGGRGITVCDEWLDPFVFYEYLESLGPRPDGHSIDRIDNDGNYEPGNVRWASVSEQNSNRSPYRKSVRP